MQEADKGKADQAASLIWAGDWQTTCNDKGGRGTRRAGKMLLTAPVTANVRFRPIADIHAAASTVRAQDEDVIVEGPESVDVRLTVEAALETSDRLLKGALEAQGQQVLAKVNKGLGKPDLYLVNLC